MSNAVRRMDSAVTIVGADRSAEYARRASSRKSSTSSTAYPAFDFLTSGKVGLTCLFCTMENEKQRIGRRGGRKYRIESVEEPAVAGQPVADVLDPEIAFDERFHQVAEG